MQQITNPYLDFGKELIAKHSGLGYYYDSISLIHPEYEEESEKQPENHNYITNITKLQILKEYNELFQNNLTFLTRVMSKKVVEKIYPSFEVRVEKKISELLPQAEKEITNSITEKYLSLKTKEETQNLTVFKQILQEKQITSQLSEKQVLQTIRNIENYENSLSHYEDVYTRQIRQTVERYAGIVVQPPALAEAKTETADAKANRQNSRKRLTDNRMLTTGRKIDAQIIPDHKDHKLTRHQTAPMGQGPAKAVAEDLIYHEDFSKDDPAVAQYTNPSGREKEFIRQEISRMVDHMDQPENQSVNRMISHIVEKRERLQNRQEDHTTVSTRIAQIIHQKIQEKQYQEERQQERQQQEKQQQEKQEQERQQQERQQQEKQQQERQRQEKQQQEKQQQERQQQERQKQEKQEQERQQQEKQHRGKPAETYNINNVNNRLINTANRLNRFENIAVSNPAKEPVNRSDYENSDLVYHEDSGGNSESMLSTKELIRHEVSQAADRLLQQENRSVLPVINNHLTYEKNNPVYNASRTSESRTTQNSDQGKGQVKEPENSQNTQNNQNNHNTQNNPNNQNNQNDQNRQIQKNNRFTDTRIQKIAQTVNRLKQLENRMVHDHTVMIINRINDGDRRLVYNSFLQTENPISGQIIVQAGHQMIHPSGNEVYQTVDNRIYPVISQISHKAGDLIHNQTIQETSRDSLQKNNNVNHIIHHNLTKTVNQMMYSQNDRNGADSYRYMEMPVELVYGAGSDNRKGDALNITAGEQNHIQEKTIQNVVKDIEFVKETKKIVKNQVHETILQKEPEKETEVVWEGTGRNSKQIMEQVLKTIDRKVDESVGQIADRVYRNLEDRLRSERNRRGY